MRLFHLERHQDPSGVSGLGRVAEGVIFGDGQVVLQWLGAYRTVGIYPSLEVVEAIHGHGGDTEIVMDDSSTVHISGAKLSPEEITGFADQVRRQLGLQEPTKPPTSPYLGSD